MDYKRIIKNRALRLKILELLDFVPDKLMIKIQYRIKTGKKLSLKEPKRYTEKMQWYKLYYKNPAMICCVDKGDVREYVKKKGLEDILLKCYGIFDTFEDIEWEKLPHQFVIKDTLGGGGVSVEVVKDKLRADIKYIKRKCQKWTSVNERRKSAGREWPYYSGKKHRIIIEEFLESKIEEGGLIDYKFLCFDGEPRYVYVLCDRTMAGGAQCGIFDINFNLLPYSENDEKRLERVIAKPKNYEQMIDVARALSKEFPEARVDLYNQEGKIYFGEITFFDSSGYMIFEPDAFDFELGTFFNVP